MQTIEIKGTVRTDLGKTATKQLRCEGKVPCVVYGGDENIHFYANENDFSKIIFTPNTYIIKLDLNGNRITSYNVCYTKLLRTPAARSKKIR